MKNKGMMNIKDLDLKSEEARDIYHKLKLHFEGTKLDLVMAGELLDEKTKDITHFHNDMMQEWPQFRTSLFNSGDKGIEPFIAKFKHIYEILKQQAGYILQTVEPVDEYIQNMFAMFGNMFPHKFCDDHRTWKELESALNKINTILTDVEVTIEREGDFETTAHIISQLVANLQDLTDCLRKIYRGSGINWEQYNINKCRYNYLLTNVTIKITFVESNGPKKGIIIKNREHNIPTSLVDYLISKIKREKDDEFFPRKHIWLLYKSVKQTVLSYNEFDEVLDSLKKLQGYFSKLIDDVPEQHQRIITKMLLI